MSAFFGITLTVLSVFLILLVLVQRGRGGGLTGALGGMGGSSAFGAKAGDLFTRITIVTATIWIILCVTAVYWANNRSDRLSSAGDDSRPINVPAGVSTTAEPGDEADAGADSATTDAGATDAGASAPAADAGAGSDTTTDDAN